MDFTQRNQNNQNQSCRRNDGLPIIGFIFIGLGLVFLFDRLNLIPRNLREILISWQALLIFIGTINLFRHHSRLPGIILILIGSAFLIPEVVNLPFEARHFIWPVLFIVIGIVIVFKAQYFKQPFSTGTLNSATNINDDRLDEVAIFGGGKRVVTSQNLSGGSITAIFGGLEIDLSDAQLKDDLTVMEVNCIFGGATIVVNPEWDVQVQVASILGGFNDKRKYYKPDQKEQTKRLIIKGSAIFGGGELKSY